MRMVIFTRYEYDDLGRRVATILPLGQRSTSQYDRVGNVVSSVDLMEILQPMNMMTVID